MKPKTYDKPYKKEIQKGIEEILDNYYEYPQGHFQMKGAIENIFTLVSKERESAVRGFVDRIKSEAGITIDDSWVELYLEEHIDE